MLNRPFPPCPSQIKIDALSCLDAVALQSGAETLQKSCEFFYLMFEMKAGPTNGGLDLDFLKNSFY